MPPTFFGTVAAATLLAIAAVNGWAFNSVRRAASTWARDAFIAQVFSLFLAGYIVVTDARSPEINWYVMATAVSVLVAAFLWLVPLGPKTKFEWTKGALIVTTLFPLAGLLQFWLQNYYIPSTSMPLVDISTELSPQGWSGQIIHLSAKVTIHNRGTTKAQIANSVMRVTAYPPALQDLATTRVFANPCWDPPDHNEAWCKLANGFDFTGFEQDTDFRVNPTLDASLVTPTPPAANTPVYAGALPQTELLVPGETDTYQREVDIDSRQVQLARLSVEAVVLTDRRIADIRSCAAKPTSLYKDLQKFSDEVQQVRQIQSARVHYLCREYDIAPGNFVEKLIGNRPAIRVYTWLNNLNQPGNEYPRVGEDFSIAGKFDPQESKLARKLTEVYPDVVVSSESEYAPTDKPAPSSVPAPPSNG
jgi:hypothetical protein